MNTGSYTTAGKAVVYLRSCGVLLHISSLPGRGGCGTLGKEARRFVDFLRAAGQSWWQVLPLTPPSKGNSPYSSHSVFAGNPYFIDPEMLEKHDLLPPGLLGELPAGTDRADFGWCERVHIELLRRSFAYAGERLAPSVRRFRAAQRFWLPDYALFMALKASFGSAEFRSWPADIRAREPVVLSRARRELAREIAFHEYVQYLFFSQWKALRRYANRRGVRLIGDIPIYVDTDSADLWAHREVFEADRDFRLRHVAGVPPDDFTADGQLWGNPLYDWGYLRATGYRWWIHRLKAACELFDTIRFDHFRGLSAYWSVPGNASSAAAGHWVRGPGIHFIRAVKRAIPGCDVIAEDLGYLDDDVRGLIQKSGFAGMKILQFAFDPDTQSEYLPHFFHRNCVGYIGTHDNDTVVGWLHGAPPKQARYARRYLRLSAAEGEHIGFIRGLYATAADRVIVQMQDITGLPGTARMNIPGIAGGNWTWRALPQSMNRQTAKTIRELASLYGRIPTCKQKR